MVERRCDLLGTHNSASPKQSVPLFSTDTTRPSYASSSLCALNLGTCIGDLSLVERNVLMRSAYIASFPAEW
jgi:hypothetical protein